jgi:hypothetical protein
MDRCEVQVTRGEDVGTAGLTPVACHLRKLTSASDSTIVPGRESGMLSSIEAYSTVNNRNKSKRIRT